MTPLPFCARVWVPAVRLHLLEVHAELEELTRESGGCTRIAARGEWYTADGEYISEPVYIYEWRGASVPDTRQLVLALLSAGEEAVMVQVNNEASLMYPHDYNLTEEDPE